MFNLFRKNKPAEDIDLVAAVDGQLMPITDIKDDVFSTKILGDAFAIKPSADQVYAPISGEVSNLFSSKHAIGISTKEGLEVLVHLGLDTVELKGEPFTLKVQQGGRVKKGEPLLTMDTKQITAAGYDDSVIIVYANMNVLKHISPVERGKVKHGQKVQTIEFK